MKKPRLKKILDIGCGEHPPIAYNHLRRYEPKSVEYHTVDTLKPRIYHEGKIFIDSINSHTHYNMSFQKFLKTAQPNEFDEIHFHMLNNPDLLIENLDKLYSFLKMGGRIYSIEDLSEAKLKKSKNFFLPKNRFGSIIYPNEKIFEDILEKKRRAFTK